MSRTKPKPVDEALRDKGFIPASEAALRLGYSTQTIYDWASAGKIHEVRLGVAHWVEWASVCAYFKRLAPEVAKLVGIP